MSFCMFYFFLKKIHSFIKIITIMLLWYNFCKYVHCVKIKSSNIPEGGAADKEGNVAGMDLHGSSIEEIERTVEKSLNTGQEREIEIRRPLEQIKVSQE